MSLVLHVAAALVGMLLVLVFLRSVFKVAVTNSPTGDWLAHCVGRLVLTALAWQARKRQSYTGIQDVLSWCLPLYMLSLIIVWFALVQAGFALLIWSSQAEHSPLQALISSGSALSTLGFLTPPGTAGQLLAILEGAMGLGIVVFFFTFIPGYQISIQLRQAKVAWLYARENAGLANFTLVEWQLLCGETDWSELWGGWEFWFRDIAETHAVAPVLAFVPTVHRGQTWLAAAAVALDSVSFYLAAVEAKGRPAATVCHRTGVDALRLIASKLPCRERPAEAVGGRRLTRCDFDSAYRRITAFGAAVRAEPDVCWVRFVQLRREYEDFLTSLAGSLLVRGYDSLLLPSAVRGDAALAAAQSHMSLEKSSAGIASLPSAMLVDGSVPKADAI
jgi:hypothetical protein